MLTRRDLIKAATTGVAFVCFPQLSSATPNFVKSSGSAFPVSRNECDIEMVCRELDIFLNEDLTYRELQSHPELTLKISTVLNAGGFCYSHEKTNKLRSMDWNRRDSLVIAVTVCGLCLTMHRDSWIVVDRIDEYPRLIRGVMEGYVQPDLLAGHTRTPERIWVYRKYKHAKM